MTFKEKIILPNMRNLKFRMAIKPQNAKSFTLNGIFIYKIIDIAYIICFACKRKENVFTFMLIATRNSTLMNNGYNIDAVRNCAT